MRYEVRWRAVSEWIETDVKVDVVKIGCGAERMWCRENVSEGTYIYK